MKNSKKGKFKDWVNDQVGKRLDRAPFSSLPLVMRIGLLILTLSFVIGYGGPLLAIIISVFNKNVSTGVLNGSLLYGFSWILGFVGLAMAGRDSVKYPLYFFAKLVKYLFPEHFKKARKKNGK
jgi:hypothetical protein